MEINVITQDVLYLQDSFKEKQQEFVITQTLPLGNYFHLYWARHYGMIKVYKTKDTLQHKWEESCASIAGKDAGIHHSQVKAATNSQPWSSFCCCWTQSIRGIPLQHITEFKLVAIISKDCLK